jgi:hypothetical protein
MAKLARREAVKLVMDAYKNQVTMKQRRESDPNAMLYVGFTSETWNEIIQALRPLTED